MELFALPLVELKKSNASSPGSCMFFPCSSLLENAARSTACKFLRLAARTYKFCNCHNDETHWIHNNRWNIENILKYVHGSLHRLHELTAGPLCRNTLTPCNTFALGGAGFAEHTWRWLWNCKDSYGRVHGTSFWIVFSYPFAHICAKINWRFALLAIDSSDWFRSLLSIVSTAWGGSTQGKTLSNWY